MVHCISFIPNPCTEIIPFTPNLPGVKALGTSNRGFTIALTCWQAVSLHPEALVATRQTLNVPVALNKCRGCSSFEVSPSPKSQKYFIAPTDWLVNCVNTFSCGGTGLKINPAVGNGLTVIVVLVESTGLHAVES